MEVLVEFQGISRVLTKSRKASFHLGSHATYRDVIHQLAAAYPSLVGEVISKDKKTFLGSNMLSVNGKRMIRPADLDLTPNEGEKLILMSILAGG
jgi:hypothetical protein